jgi:microcin C transport system substrate-binding protein
MDRCARIAAFVLAALAASPSTAEPQHAIAMHGAPKYGPQFAHFDYANPKAPKGGTLVLGEIGSFDSLNPFIIKGTVATGSDLVFERLLARSRDEPFTLYGQIAETMEVAKDRSWVIFRLRPQARFHDGAPITADDVIFSIKTLRKSGRPNHRLFYKKVAQIEKLGRLEVKLTFELGDNWELPLIMGLMPILSKAYYQGVLFDKTTLVPPLGSGPYKIANVDQGRSITYQRIPDYWGRDLGVNRGRYNFDTVRYDYFRDSVVALEAFKAGLVDVREENDPGRWAKGYDFPARHRKEVVLAEIPHGRPVGMYAFVFNTRRLVFKNPVVRKALGLAFDFSWLNKTLFHSAYLRTASYFEKSELAASTTPSVSEKALLAPFRNALPPNLFETPIESLSAKGDMRKKLRRAMDLLKEVGWGYREGRLYREDGIQAVFEILLVRPREERLALAFARNLERLGIDVSIRTVDSAQYQSRLNAYDFDMIINLWDESLSPGNEQAFYWGSKAALEEGTRNYAGVRNVPADAMIDHLVKARTREQLITASRALDRILRWGYYGVPLFYLPRDRIIYWDRIGMPEAVPLYGYQLDTWWSN